jgi:predicted ATP-binding protein involved in virulence
MNRSDEILQKKDKTPLPYGIKQFNIENFQCIKETGIKDIPIDCPWLFITGDNADGKTSLLQAITIGLYGYSENDTRDLLDNKNCRIRVEIRENGQSRITRFYWKGDHWSPVKRPANLLAYGPCRLKIRGELDMSTERATISPVFTLLRQEGNLRNIEHWIKERLLESKNDVESVPYKRVNHAKDLLVKLLPNINEIVIDGNTISYKEKGMLVPAHHLSAGHKSLLAMVGDMLIRLYEAQPDTIKPKQLQGIVIIDEFEIHLHPKWQVKMTKILSETFPLVQFIVTTHSILPFLGAPKGAIFIKVIREEEGGTKVEKIDIDIANLLPNTLLTSPLFDFDSIISTQNKKFGEIRTENDYREVVENQGRNERLKGYAKEGNLFPEEFFDILKEK